MTDDPLQVVPELTEEAAHRMAAALERQFHAEIEQQYRAAPRTHPLGGWTILHPSQFVAMLHPYEADAMGLAEGDQWGGATVMLTKPVELLRVPAPVRLLTCEQRLGPAECAGPPMHLPRLCTELALRGVA